MKPTLDSKLEKPVFIGYGYHGKVYRISEDKAAKFENAGRMAFFSNVSPFGLRLRHEYEVCKRLFELGVSVPRPHGVTRLDPPQNGWAHFGLPIKYPAFVMDYIHGAEPRTREEVAEVRKLERKELGKARDFGFIPSDHNGLRNIIWVPDEDKVYLIDFNQWRFPRR